MKYTDLKKTALSVQLNGTGGTYADFKFDGDDPTIPDSPEIKHNPWQDESINAGDGRYKITLTDDDGESRSFEFPAIGSNPVYIADMVNAGKAKDIDLGQAFYDRRFKGVTPGNMIEKAKNMDPERVAALRNAIIILRASIIKDNAEKLRAKGRNLQAFVLENKDKLLSTGIGLGAGGLGYMSAYSGLGLIPWMKQHKGVRILASLLTGAGAGTAAGILTNKYLTRHYTPSAKAKASDLVGTIGETMREGGDVMGMAGL